MIEYRPRDIAIKVGEYRGSPIMWFGTYRVELEDGFTYLHPHTGGEGTVSAWPVDFEANPEFVGHLVALAKEARARWRHPNNTHACGCDGTGQVWHGEGSLTYVTLCQDAACRERRQRAWDGER